SAPLFRGLRPHPPQRFVAEDPVVVAVGPLDLERVSADQAVGHQLKRPFGQRPIRTAIDVPEEVALPPAHRTWAVAPQHLQWQVVLAPVFPDDHELLADVDDVLWRWNRHRTVS